MTYKGVELPNLMELPFPWNEVMSLADFATLAGKDPSRVRHDIADGKIRPGHECMMYGKQWVIHVPSALDRLQLGREGWRYRNEWIEYRANCKEDLKNRGIPIPPCNW